MTPPEVPMARMFFVGVDDEVTVEHFSTLLRCGFYPEVEAPPCGASFGFDDVLLLRCDRPAGHPPEPGIADEQHRMVHDDSETTSVWRSP